MGFWDLILLLVLGGYLLCGYRRGFLRTVTGVAAVLAAIVCAGCAAALWAPQVAQWLAPYVCALLSEHSQAAALLAGNVLAQAAARVLIALTVFGLVLAVGRWLGRMLNWADRVPGIHLLNRLLGGGCGLLKGTLVLSFFGGVLALVGAIPEPVLRENPLLAALSSWNWLPV